MEDDEEIYDDLNYKHKLSIYIIEFLGTSLTEAFYENERWRQSALWRDLWIDMLYFALFRQLQFES